MSGGEMTRGEKRVRLLFVLIPELSLNPEY